MFPMMPEYQMADLIASIRAHGLLRPIARDAHGVILDGRNRLQACHAAGVEPVFETVETDRPDRYIYEENCVYNQGMNRSKRAMYHALYDPSSESADEYVSVARRVIQVFGRDSEAVKNIWRGGGSLKRMATILDELDDVTHELEQLQEHTS
jgi:hypothetical protein